MNFRTVLCLIASGAALAQDPPRAEPVDPALRRDAGNDWYQHGRNLYESAKLNADLDARLAGYQRVIDVLDRYLKEFPKHENAEAAWWFLGMSYYESGRVEDANRCFHTLMNRYQGRYATAAASTLATQHYHRRQFALAATLFEKMAGMATTPLERQQGLFNAGLSYEQQGRTREATDCYRKLLNDPDRANPYANRGRFYLGRLLARGDKLEEALELLDSVVMSDSDIEMRGQAAVQAGAISSKLGQDEIADKYLMLVLNNPGMAFSHAEAQLTLMENRFSRENYREVIQLFRRSAAKAEGEQEARRLMLAARSYVQLNQNVEALELFREVERLMPPDSQYAFEANYLRLYCFYRIEGRHVPEQVDAFLQLYRRKRPKDPKVHTALLMKAESLLHEKKVAEAAKVYGEIDSALLSVDNRPGFYFHLGSSLSMTEDPQGAVAAFEFFIKEYPGDARIPQALVRRAKAHADTGNQAMALADYDRLISLGAETGLLAEAWMRSADIARHDGNFDDMIARYRGYLEGDPEAEASKKAKANYFIAWGLVKSEKMKDAVPYAEAAREQSPKTYGENAGALLCLAWASLGEADKLCGEVDKAVAGNYTDKLPEQVIRFAAEQAFNAQRFDQAARFYAVIADEQDPEATPRDVWRFLGKSFLESGKPGEALQPIEHALKAALDNPALRADGLRDKGEALLQIGRPDEALAAAKEGMDLRPQGHINARLNILVGDIRTKQGQPAEAAGDYVRAVEFMDDNDRVLKPEAMHKLVEALEKADNRADAAKYREQLRRKYPDWKPRPAP